jgi:FtsP/CotA-like multicopper oxidase with cupredoxin domain
MPGPGLLSRRTAISSAVAAAATPSWVRAETAREPVTILRVQRSGFEVNRRPASRLTITQPDGRQGMMTAAGRRFRARVENRLDVPTLIHWHGLAPPWQQDGVPEVSSPPIAPGASAEYDFPLGFGGTFWMHSHQGFQEQELLAAPLIISDGRDRPGQQDIVVMLADFSFTPPEQIYADLRKPMSGKMAMGKMAMGGGGAGMAADAAPDLNDVKYDAFLANDRTLDDPEVIRVRTGGAVLLRIINSSSMSAYHIDLGALTGELIAVDGFQVRPVGGRRFPIAVAQRLDIRLRIPDDPAAHPVLAILEGERNQTGIILRGGKAPVRRVPPMAAKPSAALTLDLERRLRAAAPPAPRKADRVHQLDLTGSMNGYIWSINNVPWSKDTPPLPLAKGERVELVFRNQTPMPHPMHLHGHTFQVVEIDGERFPGALRDTVLVPPKSRVVVAFDADNPGWWALHCHLLYHLEAGMFTTLRYV